LHSLTEFKEQHMATSAVSSSIDVAAIVAQLMTVESKPLTVLQSKEAAFLSTISAYGSVKSSLASFQSTLTALSSPSLFASQSAVASDATVLSASTSLLATGGSYDITVTNLAKAQKLSSAGQASTISPIGTGAPTTISFQFGTVSGGTLANGTYAGAAFTSDAAQATTTLVIDGSNHTLQGIRDAINRGNLGVKATIVNDGAAGTPYRLTLTSNATGETSTMKISASAGGDPAIAALLTNDPAGVQNLTQTVNAQNAALTVDGQLISSTTNSVKDAITGVTLNLTKAGGATTSLTLSNNTAPVASAVQAMVKAYNDTSAVLKTMTTYDPVNKVGGLLHGDATIIGLQAKLRSTLATALQGMGDNKLTNITQLGVSFQKNGTLTVDSNKLQTALTENFSDFATLFTAAGKSSDSLLSVVGSSATTMPGSYPINVTVMATRGVASGVTKPTGLAGTAAANLTIGTGNDQLMVDVDGAGPIAVTLSPLAPGASAAEMAAQVESDINAALTPVQAGRVTVTESGGKLTIKSANATAGASLAVTEAAGNTGAASLFGGTPDALSTIIAGVNDQLAVSISGTSADVTMAAGTYSSTTLAQQVQAAINGTPAFKAAGIATSVASTGGVLSVTSTRYGSTSGVNITGGSGFAGLFSGVATSTPGVDVVGTIDGKPATGAGQVLSGSGGDADGIKVMVVGGATGARGDVNFSQGYAYLLGKAVDSMLSSSGALASNTDNVNRNITALQKRAATLTVQLTQMETRLRTQYTALDMLLTNMSQTSTYLTQQLAALSTSTG
jgi:flagellar hook-associated protein 2